MKRIINGCGLRVAGVFVALSPLALSACAIGELEQGATSELDQDTDVGRTEQRLTLVATLPMLQGVNPQDIVLSGSQGLYVNDRVKVRADSDPSGVYTGTVAFSGTGDWRIGTDARLGTVYSKGSPNIGDRAFLNGSLYSSKPAKYGNKSTVSISRYVDENRSFSIDNSWSFQVTWPTAINPAVNLDPVNPGQPTSHTLSPGAYASVSVKRGRQLVLTAGDYYLGGWTQDADSQLYVDSRNGPVRIYVNGDFIFRATQSGAAASGVSHPSLRVVAFGTGTSFVGRSFTGTILVPNGGLTLDAGSTARFIGAFHAKTLSVHQDSRVDHYRDTYSFANMNLIARSTVTGGTIKLGNIDTAEYEQGEAVSSVSRNGTQHIVTVSSNDRSDDASAPKIDYPSGRSGADRIVRKGVSLMGWSYSLDGGHTFKYGGKIAPPTGWAAIWGDPALATRDLDDPNVYMAQMAGTTASFESTTGYDASTQAITNATPKLVGHCIARSTNYGIGFSNVSCVNAGTFHDGTSIAVMKDIFDNRQVYLTSHDVDGDGSASVWRMDGNTMAYTALPDPFPSTGINLHPRVRHINDHIYVAAAIGAGVSANYLVGTFNSTTWNGAAQLVPDIDGSDLPLANTQTMRQANQFSFDIGFNSGGQAKVRVIYTKASTAHPGKFGLRVRECEPDLTGCVDTSWTIDGTSNDMTPSLVYNDNGRRWVASWWSVADGSSEVSMKAGLLNEATGAITVLEISPPVAPCSADYGGGLRYWGDYNEISYFGDGSFFAPYTVNGPGCRWSGEWTADMHIGGSTFSF